MMIRVFCVYAALMLPAVTQAQEIAPEEEVNSIENVNGAESGGNLAQQLSNPVASLISVPLQSNWDFGGGPNGDGMRYTLNIQPVVPIRISEDANLIVRTILPVVYQNNISPAGGSQFGLGDTVQSLFYSPRAPTAGGLIWGAGPVFLYPTATNRNTGTDKWGVGPSVVVLKQAGQATFGLLANHIWSVAGNNARSDISASFMQPFYSFTTPKATTYSLSTEATYDWKSENWIVPLNIGVSQLVRLGKQPVSFGIGGRYYVASPTGGPDWGLRFTTTLLFPKR